MIESQHIIPPFVTIMPIILAIVNAGYVSFYQHKIFSKNFKKGVDIGVGI